MDYLRLNDEGLMEVDPTVSRDQQTDFIDAYRQLQTDNNVQAATSAHALGSDLAAPYGGLHGPSDYMKSRYQTPQTESRVAALRTAAQLSALNNAMTNEINKWTNRYNKAVSAANKKSNSGNGDPEEPEYITTEEGTVDSSLRSSGPGTTTIWSGETDLSTGKVGSDVYDINTGERIYTTTPDGKTSADYSNPKSWLESLADALSGGTGTMTTVIPNLTNSPTYYNRNKQTVQNGS